MNDINSIIKAATDEIRECFLGGIADGMKNCDRNVYSGRTSEAYVLGLDIGLAAAKFYKTNTTPPPAPKADDEWPKVWISTDKSMLWFKKSSSNRMCIVMTHVGDDVEESGCDEQDLQDEIRLRPEVNA